ncbi:MAG: hypothetical protein Q8Q28_04715 [Pseudomonadota bacterium]|nr:hypothetical protein [Pseudomonadota bacterium]
MSLELIADLREKLGLLDKMKRHLAFSHTKVSYWWRVDAPFDGWSDEQLESLAALKGRFAELQDHLAFAMKLIAMIEQEDTTRFTYVLNYMVQLGIIDDMDEWLSIRDLRNAAAHDYSATEVDKAIHFHSLLQYSDYLFKTLDSLKRFVATAYPINNGKR